MAFLVAVAAAATAADELEIAIAVPKNAIGDRVAGYMSFSDSRFHVVLTNVSNRPQRIWTDGCSWGYSNLSFEISDRDGKTWRVQKKPKPWDKNVPNVWILEPHDQIVFEVEPANPEVWEGFPHPDRSQSFKMQAIFEVKPDRQSKVLGVWTGRVVLLVFGSHASRMAPCPAVALRF
jgi:hypothetical protein